MFTIIAFGLSFVDASGPSTLVFSSGTIILTENDFVTYKITKKFSYTVKEGDAFLSNSELSLLVPVISF